MNRNSAQLHLGIKFQFGPCGKRPYCHTQKDIAYRDYVTRVVITVSHPSAQHWQ
jgi:hypothetical protein